MTHARAAHIPLDYLAAEVAAAPLVGLALPIGPTKLEPKFSARSLTGQLWRATEVDLIARFRGISVDEIVSYRDAIWFPGMRNPQLREERESPVPLEVYLRRLASEHLKVEGASLRARVPRWSTAETIHTGEAGPTARAARHNWRWMTFSLPWDLLAAALPGKVPVVEQVTWLSPHANQWLSDAGFAEVHCHLGATPDFRALWVWAMRAASERTGRATMFQSPGAERDDGRHLAMCVLLGAMARFLLADFLRVRDRAGEAFTFRKYLSPAPGVDTLLARSTEQPTARRAMSALCTGGFASDISFVDTAAGYRALAGQAGDTYIESWRAWIRRGAAADPMNPLLPGEVAGLTGTAEMRWLRACLAYVTRETDIETQRPQGSYGQNDPLFAQVFWQAVRARNAFYRHLVQRPLTPGLQWFIRTFRRIGPARRNVPCVSLAEYAVTQAGAGHGLRSFEVRIAPETRLDDLRRAVEDVWDGCRLAARRAKGPNVADVLMVEDRRLRGGRRVLAADGATNAGVRGTDLGLECGIVIHFTKRRGGGIDDGNPHAHALSTEADPRNERNVNRYRFGGYFQSQSRQARIIADLFRRWPAVLHFIRGIDVCTDEAGIPTWVIAPLFRIVRSAASDAAVAASHIGFSLPPLRATAHAGEDFVHLLTGLRRVDETLTHLVLQEGDRLGHAMALGIDPGRWAASAGHVLISRDDRLQDLVWEWKLYQQGRAEPAGDRGRRIEEEIRILAEDIFGKPLAVPQVERIFCRLFDRFTLFDECGFPGDRWQPQSFHSDFFEQRDDSSGQLREVKQCRLDYLQSDRVFDRSAVLVGVNAASEGAALAVLQVALQRRVAQQGIALEINPTSNLLIGDLSDLAHHPLWRLRPPKADPDRPPIDVCIGSDDPITFATTLRDEYQLVLDALEQGRVAQRDAHAWLDDARRAGLTYRFTRPTWEMDPFMEGFVVSR